MSFDLIIPLSAVWEWLWGATSVAHWSIRGGTVQRKKPRPLRLKDGKRRETVLMIVMFVIVYSMQ